MRVMRVDAGRLPLVASLLLAACAPGDGAPEGSDPADAEVPALTREEIEERAEAMTPEMAESLGIIDTTIRIERPMPAESVRAPGFTPDSSPPPPQ